MRSTSKRRLDMSRVFHGLQPLGRVVFWQPPVPTNWMFSPCNGDVMFAPVHDAAPVETKDSQI